MKRKFTMHTSIPFDPDDAISRPDSTSRYPQRAAFFSS
jgi:hypothetical protein